jgi:hypothetical protein
MFLDPDKRGNAFGFNKASAIVIRVLTKIGMYSTDFNISKR